MEQNPKTPNALHSIYKFYINLDRRTDRRELIEKEFAKMGLEVERFPAIEKVTGALGCSHSHLEVLKLARERNYPEVMIFEDDFEFLVDKPTFEDIVSRIPYGYDVVLFGYHVPQSQPYNEHFGRVLEAQAGSCYVVSSRFYDTLISTWEKSVAEFDQNPHCHWLYINDQSWKPLQPISYWFYSLTRIGRQRPNWSDISNDFVNYKV